jgi:hypothetical protein
LVVWKGKKEKERRKEGRKKKRKRRAEAEEEQRDFGTWIRILSYCSLALGVTAESLSLAMVGPSQSPTPSLPASQPACMGMENWYLLLGGGTQCDYAP